MQGLTLTIAFAGSLLVLFLRPAKALAIYVAVVLMYPGYLVVQVGPLDISAARIVISVFLLRCLFNPKLMQSFKWCRLDSWVTFGAIILVSIPLISSDMSAIRVLENRSGRLMDTFLVYLIARFCITDRKTMITAIKWVGVALVPLACLGVIESYTGWQPFTPFFQYCPWLRPDQIGLTHPRLGFYRAIGPFGHSISFGAVFVTILPLVYCLRYETGYWRSLSYVLVGFAAIGALSSMSSGPWMILIIIIGCLALEHFKDLVKPLIVFMVLSCLLVDIISNRNFYDVIASYANPIEGGGGHRAKLIHLAIEHFDKWWLVGYGGRDPGWGESLGMTWTDITNHYVMAGVEHGLLGLISVCGTLVVAIQTLMYLYKSTSDPVLQSWYWALGSIIIVLAIAFNAIAFTGQDGALFYCILGIIGSSAKFVTEDFSSERRRITLQCFAPDTLQQT